MGYVNSDYVDDMNNRRSTIEYVFPCRHLKQSTWRQVKIPKKPWLTKLVRELGVEQRGVEHCDSQSVIYLENNKVYHIRTKQIDVSFRRSEIWLNLDRYYLKMFILQIM